MKQPPGIRGSSLWLTKPVSYLHKADMDSDLGTPRVCTIFPGWVDIPMLVRMAGQLFVDRCIEGGLLVEERPIITPGRRRGSDLWCPARSALCPYIPDCGDKDCQDKERP